jgi:hypothetical protein
MIYSKDFVWLHFPKCAGTKIERLFATYFSNEKEITQDLIGPQRKLPVLWHDSIAQREARDPGFVLGDRTVICSIRRLPSWLVSRYNFEYKRSPQLDYRPERLLVGRFLEQHGRENHADSYARKYLPMSILESGEVRFIRTEYFEDDFKSVFGDYIDISRIPDREFSKKENVTENNVPLDIRNKLDKNRKILYGVCPYWKMVEDVAYLDTRDAEEAQASEEITQMKRLSKQQIMNLPNFFIVGANKAGTTSLHYYCSQHPEIFMAKVKEPMFFSSDGPVQTQHPDKGNKNTGLYYKYSTLQEYMALFESATEPVRGESTTNYLSNTNAAMWISKFNPNSKIIAILRNPIERAISDFEFQIKVNKSEKRSLSQAMRDALNNRIDPRHKDLVGDNLSIAPVRYLKLGLYGSQISIYKRYFTDKQLLIADYEEYNNEIIEFVIKVFSFLGVSEFTPPDIKRLNTSGKPKPELDADLLNDMKEFFRDDVLQLQKLVDFDVMKWLD